MFVVIWTYPCPSVAFHNGQPNQDVVCKPSSEGIASWQHGTLDVMAYSESIILYDGNFIWKRSEISCQFGDVNLYSKCNHCKRKVSMGQYTSSVVVMYVKLITCIIDEIYCEKMSQSNTQPLSELMIL